MRPGRRAGKNGTPSCFMRPGPLHARLREALAEPRLPLTPTWYQCTRHAFASKWVMADGWIEKLAAVLGHSLTEVTRRYAHLRPEHFREADRRLLAADLERGNAAVIPLAKGGEIVQRMCSAAEAAPARKAIPLA